MQMAYFHANRHLRLRFAWIFAKLEILKQDGMQMYKRSLQLDKNLEKSVFLLGPRGTGKTHFLRDTFPEALYFDLLHTETYSEFLSNPSVLEARIPKNYDGVVIIDEIQKVPALLDEVHRLIEHQGRCFILTGSSARALRKRGVNLLAGRALTHHMHPLTIQEVGEDFILQKAILTGMLPSTFEEKDSAAYLKSYVQTYLKEEVQQEAVTRNIPLFARFLRVASFSQGEALNFTNIAREVGVSRQSIANFFDVLEDLLIAVRIPVFARRAKREMVANQKFYYFDTGVYRSLRPKGPLDRTDEIDGAALETLFLQHVRALNDYHNLGYEVFYWRTRSQLEIDFVLYGERGFVGFEIKRKANLDRKDFKGMRAFLGDYPEARGVVLYGGTRAYHDNGIDMLPFEQGLRKLDTMLGFMAVPDDFDQIASDEIAALFDGSK